MNSLWWTGTIGLILTCSVIMHWQNLPSCFDVPPEALSTLCGGQGVTVFFGMAEPVHAPQIGPVRQP